MLTFIRREPAAIVGVIVAVVALVIAFGIPISADQKAAIVGVVTAVLSLLGAGAVRANVTPVKGKRNEAGEVTIDLFRLAVVVILLLILLLGVGLVR